MLFEDLAVGDGADAEVLLVVGVGVDGADGRSWRQNDLGYGSKAGGSGFKRKAKGPGHWAEHKWITTQSGGGRNESTK